MKSTKRVGAALLVVSLAALAPAVAGEPLHGFEIRHAFGGITLDGIYRGGAFFSETYNVDGTIRYHDADGADSGEWSVRGDTFCTFYDRQPGACFYVLGHGENCFTFHQSVEDKTGRQGPGEDWAAEGWNRDRPATCPKAPEAEI
jgi:hypothetical protein